MILSPNSLSQRSLRSVWHPCTQMKQHEKLPPLAIVRGEGAWLQAENGDRSAMPTRASTVH